MLALFGSEVNHGNGIADGSWCGAWGDRPVHILIIVHIGFPSGPGARSDTRPMDRGLRALVSQRHNS